MRADMIVVRSMVLQLYYTISTRRIDEAVRFSFEGAGYEAGAALANLEDEIAYDPMNTQAIMVCCKGTEPADAHRMEIGAYASKAPPVPVGMTGSIPETSGLLDALEKKYLLLYLSDSKLTPRRLYAGLLGQPGLEAHFSAGISNVCCRKRSGQSVRNRKSIIRHF